MTLVRKKLLSCSCSCIYFVSPDLYVSNLFLPYECRRLEYKSRHTLLSQMEMTLIRGRDRARGRPRGRGRVRGEAPPRGRARAALLELEVV